MFAVSLNVIHPAKQKRGLALLTISNSRCTRRRVFRKVERWGKRWHAPRSLVRLPTAAVPPFQLRGVHLIPWGGDGNHWCSLHFGHRLDRRHALLGANINVSLRSIVFVESTSHHAKTNTVVVVATAAAWAAPVRHAAATYERGLRRCANTERQSDQLTAGYAEKAKRQARAWP